MSFLRVDDSGWTACIRDEDARSIGLATRDHGGAEACVRAGYNRGLGEAKDCGNWYFKFKCNPQFQSQDHKNACCLANSKVANSQKIVNGVLCDPLFRDPSKSHCNTYLNMYCKDNNKVLNDDNCKDLSKTNQTLFNQLMKDTCNSSDELAESSGCIDWCQSNARECTRLTTLKDCIKYGITKSECTSSKVAEVRTACIKGGILSEQGLSTGWQCNPNALLKLDETCATYNISKDTCTPIQIAEAEANELQKELAAKALEESNRKYLATQKAISDILGQDIQPMIEGTDSTTKVDDKNSFKYLIKGNEKTILVIIIVIILCLSLSMMML
jgi:hypothetical protein